VTAARRGAGLALGIAGLGAALLCAAPAARAQDGGAARALAAADAAWAARAEGARSEGRAAEAAADAALRAAEAAIDAAPDDLGPRWRLLRALHFRADFASAGPGAERAVLERATREADAAKAVLARRVGAATAGAGDASALAALPPERLREAVPEAQRADAAAVYFWSAVAWGAWSQRTGLLAAVREGVANRVHRDALAAAALDGRCDDGGPHRLLARLHATLPRLPLVSGWVDRAQALPEMERALAIAPDHLGNRLLLALTLLDLAPERRAEALGLLREAAAASPRESRRVEEEAIRAEARERLAQEERRAPG